MSVKLTANVLNFQNIPHDHANITSLHTLIYSYLSPLTHDNGVYVHHRYCHGG